MSESPNPPYREVEHTADLGLYVSGANLEALFANAARGMYALMRCAPAQEPRHAVRREVSLTAFDAETLLVDWLDELLYANETQHEVYSRFAFAVIDATHIEATLEGEAPHPAGRGIKAVTFAGLRIDRTLAGKYETTITFDV